MRNAVCFWVLLFAGLAAHQASADSLYTFSSVSESFTDNPLSLGFSFTVNSTFDVSALGWFDDTGTGFETPHTVGIFDCHGNLLASATLAAGASGTLTDSFRYQAIAPITLEAGFTYTLAGTTGGLSDSWTDNDLVTNFTVNPAFTVGPDAALFTYMSELVDPDSHFSDYRTYIGPNLEGTTVSADTSAPEPRAVLLLLVGGLSLLILGTRGRVQFFRFRVYNYSRGLVDAIVEGGRNCSLSHRG